MKPTMKALREKTKRACHAARKVTNVVGQSRYEGMNMLEAWRENKRTIRPFLEGGEESSMVVPQFMLDFHYAGEVYYHAKEHGLQSAMMLRLQRI